MTKRTPKILKTPKISKENKKETKIKISTSVELSEEDKKLMDSTGSPVIRKELQEKNKTSRPNLHTLDISVLEKSFEDSIKNDITFEELLIYFTKIHRVKDIDALEKKLFYNYLSKMDIIGLLKLKYKVDSLVESNIKKINE